MKELRVFLALFWFEIHSYSQIFVVRKDGAEMRTDETKECRMKQLDSELRQADFYGFALQSEFWYGYNLSGQPVASSGWICNGSVYICELPLP